MKRRVFVTGINGLLGTNLVHALLHKGYDVTGIIREKASYRGIQHPDLTIHRGNLTDDLSKLLTDTEIVVHAAAETRQDLCSYDSYKRVNVDLSIKLIDEAIACKVKQFIFISTANTIGYGTSDRPGEEWQPAGYPFTHSYYARSKTAAEELILSRRHLIKVIIINPSFILGRYDSKPGSGKIVQIGLCNRIVLCPPGGKNIVHAEDVAKAVIQSFEYGKNGERYLIVNENLTYQEFFKKLRSTTGKNFYILKVPGLLLIIAGIVGSLLKLTGIRSSVSLNTMRILCVCNFYTNSKSIHQLHMKYQSADKAIADTAEYLISLGRVQKSTKK